MNGNSNQTVVKDENMIIAQKGVKGKLANWYVKNFDKSKSDDKLRKAVATSADIQNAVGGVLVGIFAPYLEPGVPAFQKKYKKDNLDIYDKIKGKIDDKVGIERKEDEMNAPEQGFVNQQGLSAIGDFASSILNKNGRVLEENPELAIESSIGGRKL